MAITLKDFFIVSILICGVKSSCYVGWNGEVDCISTDRVSIMVLNQLEGISETKTITIRDSHALEIIPGAFRTADNVKQIVLNNNTIDTMYKGTFKNIPIKNLIIEFNDIDEIEIGAFSNLSRLEGIFFHNNNFAEIPAGLFANLSITTLKLDSNGISIMEDMVLRDLPKLTFLSLYDNKLQWIFLRDILTYPERLEVLHLQNNRLTSISNYMLFQLTGLTDLNLQNNSIFHIEPRSFSQTPLLERLDLSGNHLKEIEENVFPSAGMENVEELYLNHNKLMYLSPKFFLRVGYLKKVTIFGNPWRCPCLNDMEKMFAEEGITGYTYEEYLGGRRPTCVNEKVVDTECRMSYNELLSQKYVTSLSVKS